MAGRRTSVTASRTEDISLLAEQRTGATDGRTEVRGHGRQGLFTQQHDRTAERVRGRPLNVHL